MGTIDALNIELTAELAIQKSELRKGNEVEPGLLIKIAGLLKDSGLELNMDIPGIGETLEEDAWLKQLLNDCEKAIAGFYESRSGNITGREFLDRFDKVKETLNERPF